MTLLLYIENKWARVKVNFVYLGHKQKVTTKFSLCKKKKKKKMQSDHDFFFFFTKSTL